MASTLTTVSKNTMSLVVRSVAYAKVRAFHSDGS